jgi:hypothetical protein
VDFAPVRTETVLIRVETTGQFHLRYRIGGRWVDDSRCRIDENNWVRADFQMLEEADPGLLCGFCFPW